MQQAKRLTYQDLLGMFPEEDIVRRELIDGELFVSPSPTRRHQRAVRELTTELTLHSRRHGGEVLAGPFDVYISERDVLEPDVLFIREQHVSRVEERYTRFPPDLVVEVSSPSTKRRDRTAKKDLYERFGVPEYWFVDLDADRVEVHRLDEGRYAPPRILVPGDVLDSPEVPGFSLPVADLLGRSDA